jgi:nucleotide-binding universal stress UspA family protein
VNINQILVPVDFSPPSVLAVNHGVAFARKLKARLTLLHVVTPWAGQLYTLAGEAEQMRKEREEWAQNMLPSLIGPEDQDDLDVRFVVKAGAIENVIESFVHEGEADLVVMGTHGRGLFARLLLGSVTQALLRRLGVPVLTVCHASAPLDFKRLLFATDFGFDSHKGFHFALDVAAATHSRLIVAHAIDASHMLSFEVPDVSEAIEQGREQAVRYARQKFLLYEAEGRKRDVAVECVLLEGKAAESIARLADEQEVDLMILGLRKKGLFERTVLGSTAEPLIRAMRVPVLSFPIDTAVTVVEDEPQAKPA